MSVNDRLLRVREVAADAAVEALCVGEIVAERVGPVLERLLRFVGRLSYYAFSLAMAVLAWYGLIDLLSDQQAFAATSEVSKNIGAELKSWGTALLFAVAALVAIPVLARRDVSGGLVLTGLVVLVGGFVYASGTVVTVIKGIWRSIAV